MNSKIKILIGVLVVGIVLVGGWWFWSNQTTEGPEGVCGPIGMGSNYDVSYCDKSCNTDDDCKFSCGCGAINKDEVCHDEGIIYDCIDHDTKCEKGRCVIGEEKLPPTSDQKNPQIDCLGSCRCMEKCNKKGPTYFIPVDEGSRECSVNSINKICCCSGV